MYGGPHHGGPHGPGFGGPHDFHGHHDHYGFYGHGPHYRYYHHLRPYYYGASKIDKGLDYMKIIESDEEGKKYYNFCGCEKCSVPFGLDYRNAENVTFISTNGVTFNDGNYEYTNKVDGLFKFTINCPECNGETVFFVNLRTIPEFVRNRYLEKTRRIEYVVQYIFSGLNKNQVINFNVCKNVENLSIKNINDYVSKLDFDYLIRKDVEIVVSRYQLSDIALRSYEKITGFESINVPTFKVNVKNLTVNNNIFSKFRRTRYLVKTNGIKGIKRAFNLNEEDKENIQLLIKK